MKNIQFRKFSTVALVFVSVAALFGGAYYFGYTEGVKKPKTILVREVEGIAQGKPAGVDFSTFWEIWNLLRERHININEIDTASLVSGAIEGMVNSLKDPYTVFMAAPEAKRFSEDIGGEFSGIGAEIGRKNGNIIIVAPLKGTPAEHAGVKSGDVVLKIDEAVAQGMTVQEAVSKIRGERGTSVTLTIFREGFEDSREISIVRSIIQIPTLDWRILEAGQTDGKKIAYIQLYNFYEKSFPLFYRAALNIIAEQPDGIILDLRNNPGGYLGSSVSIAGLMLSPGTVVVSEKTRSPKTDKVMRAAGPALLQKIPVVVLVNAGSASASEILAGALRDQRKIPLVGEVTFGKGSVQEALPVRDTMLKVTIAHWVLPSGDVIEKNGLMPDYEVKMDEEDDIEFGDARDAQFKKALQLLIK